MTINRKLERKKEEVTDMMYEDVAKDIQRVIEEQIELEMVELRGNGEPQFKVTMIDGEELPEDVVMMVNLKRTFSFMSASRTYIPIDISNWHGFLEVYYCKKKKGMFGRDSLKVISSIRKGYHKDKLEKGEEKQVSLKFLRGNK